MRYFYKPNSWFEYTDGGWIHSTPLKRTVNPLLRYIQFWTDRPLVIASYVDFDGENIPNFKKYVLKRVKYERSRKQRRMPAIKGIEIRYQNDE
jgi:hypothetical protein